MPDGNIRIDSCINRSHFYMKGMFRFAKSPSKPRSPFSPSRPENPSRPGAPRGPWFPFNPTGPIKPGGPIEKEEDNKK